MNAPVITIFVRHAANCKYAGDEFTKQCKCRKHFRWTQNGKQYRRKAGTRSWSEAEEQKRRLAGHLTGHSVEKTSELLLCEAIETFTANKAAQGVKPRVLKNYARELARLLKFSEGRNLLSVKQALTIENLVSLRATWVELFKSSYSRSAVQKNLNHFLRFCYNAGWIDRIPKLSPIKIDEPETMPLSNTEYEKILDYAGSPRIRTVIKLMRWAGLAVRDASTLKRTDIHHDAEKDLYRIIRERAKTGTSLYIPIPKAVALEILEACSEKQVYVFWDRQTETSSEYRHADYMGECISNAFKKAGVISLGHMVSHRLRATFAVDLLQKGVPLEHVSKLLGHKSVTTTERHYAKWVKGRQDRLDSIVSATWAAPITPE